MAYVRAGGKLLLTHEAGTLEHDGTSSDDPLLAGAADGADDLTHRTVGEGEIWHYAPKVGKLAHEQRQLPAKYNRGGGYMPPEDPAMVAAIQRIAATVLGEEPHFAVDAPSGLLAWIYEAEHDGRPARCVHLLNCTGRDYEEGHPIEFDHDNPPPMPPLPEMTMRLPGAVAEAILATPEREGAQALQARMEDGVTMLTIPAESFETYGVVWAYDE